MAEPAAQLDDQPDAPDPWEGYGPEQRAALSELAASLSLFAQAFTRLAELGIKPSEALRACGIGVPAIAAPALDKMLADALAAAA